MDGKTSLSPFQQPIFLPEPPPPPPLRGGGFSLNNKVSPSILLIIIILAIIFFISGLLHLLVRYLLRPSTRDPDDLDNVTALQGQLQQLFHLHDAGVDQSFIDTLPIFNYKAIIGLKNQNHFDCAVCLCEFEAEDKLRLLPKCSHAFHMECIDTWLLSHSTCPLCRASLLPDYSMASPIVLVLESGSESSREICPEREGVLGNAHTGNCCDDDLHNKSCEIQEKEEGNQEKVVKVKLGKFRNVDSAGEGSSSSGGNSNGIDSRRCFSMGSFAYIMDDNTSLHVPIRMKKQASKKPVLPLTPGHRVALSECGCDSRREFNGFEAFRFSEIQTGGNMNINPTSAAAGDGNEINKVVKEGKRESFSVSKIWLRGKKDSRPNSAADGSSRRAVSFRFPVHSSTAAMEGTKAKSGGGGSGSGGASVSEIGIDGWAHGECCDDVENDGSNIVNSQANAPSFGRRTLIWLMGRQNKVVHSTFSSNV